MPPAAPQSRVSAEGIPYSERIPYLLLLGAVLLFSWLGWAVFLKTTTVPSPPLLSVVARLVLWGGPCAAYLYWVAGNDWARVLGLGFPGGRRQIVSAVLVPSVVGFLLLLGTSRQLEVPLFDLVGDAFDSARLRLTAPVLEELVFRGVVVSEAMAIARDTAKDVLSLRLRFWLAQLAAALLFTLVHWPWWLSELGLVATLQSSMPLFVTGLVLGIVFAMTRSIWGCILLHWLNNELSLLGS